MFSIDDPTGQEDSEYIDQFGDDSHYNELFESCGYHVSFARNMVPIITMLLVFTFIWFLVAYKVFIVSCFCNHKDNRQEVFWNNFLIRFLYEVFFEICICMLLSFSVSYDRTKGWVTLLKVVFMLLTIGCLVALSVCCIYKGGP